MKLEVIIITRRCNTFKEWSIDCIFPYDMRTKNYYLNFEDFKHNPSLPSFIGLKRKAITRTISIPNFKVTTAQTILRKR